MVYVFPFFKQNYELMQQTCKINNQNVHDNTQ